MYFKNEKRNILPCRTQCLVETALAHMLFLPVAYSKGRDLVHEIHDKIETVNTLSNEKKKG